MRKASGGYKAWPLLGEASAQGYDDQKFPEEKECQSDSMGKLHSYGLITWLDVSCISS
jgi:hypothetical protein